MPKLAKVRRTRKEEARVVKAKADQPGFAKTGRAMSYGVSLAPISPEKGRRQGR